MAKTPKRRPYTGRVAKVAARFLLVVLVGALGVSAAAARPAEVIVLPGATSAEGIAAGRGKTFYAGDLFAGDIYRGDMQHGTAELFIDAPAGRQARRHGRRPGARVALRRRWLHRPRVCLRHRHRCDRGDLSVRLIRRRVVNDVALTKDGAWFTDSVQAKLYFVPVSAAGVPGPFSTLALSGPAADTSGAFNLNGIQATSDGKTLIVAHSANGELYTVDPVTGASATIDGVSVPNVDGIVLNGTRLWAVQNFDNQVARVRLSPHLTSGVVEEVITNDLFQVPATAARFGSRLAVVNAKFDTGVPPTAEQYEVVVVDA